MFRKSIVLFFAAIVYPQLSVADDIEIYFTEGAESEPYVLLVQDMNPNTFSTAQAACSDITDPDDCQLSPDALTRLKEFRDNDATGTCPDSNPTRRSDKTPGRWEIYRAVLATVLTQKIDDDGLNDGIWDPNQDEAKYLQYGDLKLALAASNHKSVSGGTMLMKYTRLNEGGVEKLLEDLQAAPCNMRGNDAHDFGPIDVYLEWFSYLNGYDVQNGIDTTSNFLGPDAEGCINPDYDPDTIDGLTNEADCEDVVHEEDAGRGYDYLSPFSDDSCPVLYSIMASMTGSVSGQDGSLENVVAHGFPSSAFSPPVPSATFIEYMHRDGTDLVPTIDTVVPLEKTWVISDLGGNPCDPNGIVTSCGNSDIGEMAEAGGTAPLDINDATGLEAELGNILGEILSVSSSFVSASVPVNVFNQTQSLDNIFTSLFEAQSTLNWPGNVKKLKLNDSNDDGVFDGIIDASNPPKPGFETTGSNKGRIFFTALTYWTDPGTLPPGDTSFDANEPEYVPVGVDGRVVDRGAAGQHIPGFVNSYDYILGNSNSQTSPGKTTRKVYVEQEILAAPDASYDITGTNMEDFGIDLAGNATFRDLLGESVTEAEAKELILWGRGVDISGATDPDTVALDPNAARDWIMGDSIHSRPFALNYGDTDGPNAGIYDKDTPNIRLFFGTGNGSFHALQNTVGSAESGMELFAYYPRELLAQLKRRSSDTTIAAGTEMYYGADGAPVVLTVDENNDQSLTVAGGDEAFVYFGLRRGGYSYHALDVIDPTSPKLQWKVTETRSDEDANTTDFDELGLTFSTPRVTKLNYNGDTKDVLVFAGGYCGGIDPNDPDNQLCKDIEVGAGDPFGNAIYVVDARSGELIWKATGGVSTGASNTDEKVYTHTEMKHSIPSDGTILENRAGVLHRLYVGDTGGSVWRAHFPSGTCDADPTPCSDADADWRQEKWFVSRFADLSDSADIRFFHAPDVIEVKDEAGNAFDAVIIQGGNRADPLNNRFTAVQNYLYYIRDYNVVSGDATSVIAKDDAGQEIARYDAGDLANRTNCITGNEATSPSSLCEPLVDAGWKIAFNEVGEKGLSTPLTDGGRIFNSTYVPISSAGECGVSPEGKGELYITNTVDGSAVSNERSYELGPGIPPSPVVIGDAIWLPGGGINEDLDGEDGTDGILTKSFTDRLVPIYWREPGIDDL